MYIKIKYIKRFILIVLCFFLAGFNYLTYVKADSKSVTDESVCNKSIDSDCDGLINTEEKLYGTNSKNADTDGDGYSDGVEVKSGFDPLKPAPGDKIETGKSTPVSSVQNSVPYVETLTSTDDYLQNLAAYLSTKNGQSLSTSDVKTFSDEQMAKYAGDTVTLDSLPAVDESQIKLLKQDYSGLSETVKKEREAEDALTYIKQMGYLLISNAPTKLLSNADFYNFYDTFFYHLTNLASKDASDYFSDLGNRLGSFLDQSKNVPVPESMLDIHIKFLRIIKGILTLKDLPVNITDTNDPMGKIVLSDKISAYTELIENFFHDDLQNYLDKFK